MTKAMEKFIQKLDSTESVFDLMEVAYGILSKEIENEPAFIAKYMAQSPMNNTNPNCNILRDFYNTVALLFSDYFSIKYKEQKEKIKISIQGIKLEKYGEAKENELSFVFQLLLAINCAANNWDKYKIRNNWGPLNGKKGNYAVYFWDEESYMCDLKEYIGREKVRDGGFQEFVNNFIFINRKTWIVKGKMPNVVAIKPNNIPNLKLKIAMIYPGKEKSFQFVPYMGSLLKVEYLDQEQNNLYSNMILQMKNAILEGANIIILPEFIVSAQILSKIREQICLWRRDKKFNSSNLFAVFAGSTADGSQHNNIMNILDSWGNIIGQYYKYSAYRKKDENGKGYKECEFIKNPGEKCSIIFVQGIGSFLPAICRDVIDGKYTAELVNIFMPLFVIVSAWSRSTNSFKKYFEEYATKYFTNSVLCNSCDAISVKNKDAVVGIASSVEKAKTIAEAKIELCKREQCFDKCKKGCCFIITYCFEKKALTNGRLIQVKRIFGIE